MRMQTISRRKFERRAILMRMLESVASVELASWRCRLGS